MGRRDRNGGIKMKGELMTEFDETGFFELLERQEQETQREPTPEEIRRARYLRLARIFAEKATGLKRIAIDKPYMTAKAIDDQYAAYEAMYEAAKRGLYDEAKNAEIIAANESAKALVAPANLLLNAVRSKLEVLIAADTDGIDKMLDAAEAVSLGRDDLTPGKLAEIKGAFDV